MLDQIEELQKFLNLPAAKGLIKAIVFRSLESSLNIYESDLPTWKSHVTDLAMLSGTLSLATLGFEGLPLLFSAAIPTVFMWVDGPSVARHISRRKNLKTMKRREEELIDHSVSQRGIETVAAEVARDEAREDKADFQFGIIMKEIKDGLSVSEFYKLSQWGSGFDRGFVNIVDRHNSLKNRLDLIARELDPVLTELKNGSPDLSRLKSLQRLVEISSPQAQNLQMDINFLKTDYLALGIALDRYILDLDALSKDPDLLDRQRDQINRRRERLEMRKKNLETSAFALGPILALHESVIVSLEDYQDIISMDMSEKLRQ